MSCISLLCLLKFSTIHSCIIWLLDISSTASIWQWITFVRVFRRTWAVQAQSTLGWSLPFLKFKEKLRSARVREKLSLRTYRTRESTNWDLSSVTYPSEEKQSENDSTPIDAKVTVAPVDSYSDIRVLFQYYSNACRSNAKGLTRSSCQASWSKYYICSLPIIFLKQFCLCDTRSCCRLIVSKSA